MSLASGAAATTRETMILERGEAGGPEMTVSQQQTHRPPKHLVGWAWLAIAVVPVGFALSVAALFSLAAAMNVELFPADDSQEATFVQGLILAVVTAVVALAAPTVATILSVKAARTGERSAKAAQVLAIGALAVACLAILLGVGSVVGAVGLLIVGLTLVVALRQHRPQSRGQGPT